MKTYNSKVLHESLQEYKNYVCELCNCQAIHNGKPLRLQVDHIDGNNKNNNLENLRFLCPNCHSQTETFTGKNAKTRNYNKPSKEEFLELYKKFSVKEISILKAVSNRVVYNWFKEYSKRENKLSCAQIQSIKLSKRNSEEESKIYGVSSRLIRFIRSNKLYTNCN